MDDRSDQERDASSAREPGEPVAPGSAFSDLVDEEPDEVLGKRQNRADAKPRASRKAKKRQKSRDAETPVDEVVVHAVDPASMSVGVDDDHWIEAVLQVAETNATATVERRAELEAEREDVEAERREAERADAEVEPADPEVGVDAVADRESAGDGAGESTDGTAGAARAASAKPRKRKRSSDEQPSASPTAFSSLAMGSEPESDADESDGAETQDDDPTDEPDQQQVVLDALPVEDADVASAAELPVEDLGAEGADDSALVEDSVPDNEAADEAEELPAEASDAAPLAEDTVEVEDDEAVAADAFEPDDEDLPNPDALGEFDVEANDDSLVVEVADDEAPNDEDAGEASIEDDALYDDAADKDASHAVVDDEVANQDALDGQVDEDEELSEAHELDDIVVDEDAADGVDDFETEVDIDDDVWLDDPVRDDASFWDDDEDLTDDAFDLEEDFVESHVEVEVEGGGPGGEHGAVARDQRRAASLPPQPSAWNRLLVAAAGLLVLAGVGLLILGIVNRDDSPDIFAPDVARTGSVELTRVCTETGFRGVLATTSDEQVAARVDVRFLAESGELLHQSQLARVVLEPGETRDVDLPLVERLVPEALRDTPFRCVAEVSLLTDS